MGVRLNSEKKIENENFKLKIGTTNKINPMVIYVEGKAFISPLEEKDDYSRDISEMKHALKRSISTNLYSADNFDNKYIVDFQVASSGVAVNKKSFLSFQFLLRQKRDNIMKLSDVKAISEGMINNIADALRDSIIEHNFVLSKTKK
jgi:hypothetical protein